jgi:hypothetical protein
MKRLLSAIGLAFVLAAGTASANIVYTFTGVTFTDGGTLTGTFTTNDSFSTLIDYNITTSPGIGIGFTYTPATAPNSFSSLPSILVVEDSGPDNILQVTFDGGLTATGASILVGFADSFEQHLTARREITAGSVTVAVVPEPSTIALLGIGVLAVLAYVRRRRYT